MCGRCRRTLLTGERFRYWHPPEIPQERQPVCDLCDREVTELGWERETLEPLRENAVGARATVRLVA